MRACRYISVIALALFPIASLGIARGSLGFPHKHHLPSSSSVTQSQPWGDLDPDAAWSAWPEQELLKTVNSWYAEFGHDLERVRAKARTWSGKPQSDDIEMAISYLRIRATKPKAVWECAPADGWSSLFILQALRDNEEGELFSFGLESQDEVFGRMRECCPELMDGWKYREGKLEGFVDSYNFTQGTGGFADTYGFHEVPSPNYIYLDALHNFEFGQMYGNVLLRKVPGHVYVSMHDSYRDGWSTSSQLEKKLFARHPHRPMPETQGALLALAASPKKTVCRGFTTSRSYSSELFNQLQTVHSQYVQTELLNAATLNPTLYFELGSSQC